MNTTPSPAVQRCIDAAQALADRGEKVTLAAVRAEAGGGSMNTVTEAVHRWREQARDQEQPQAVAIPDAVTEAGSAAVATIWKAAQAQHRAAIEAEREALAQAQAEAQAEVQETAELAAILESDLEKARAEAASEAARAAKAEKEAQARAMGEQACQARLEAAQRELEQLRGRVERLEIKTEQAQAEAAELRGELRVYRPAGA